MCFSDNDALAWNVSKLKFLTQISIFVAGPIKTQLKIKETMLFYLIKAG